MNKLLAQTAAQIELLQKLITAAQGPGRGTWVNSPSGDVAVRVDALGRLRGIALADDWACRNDWETLERLINDTVRQAMKLTARSGDQSAA